LSARQRWRLSPHEIRSAVHRFPELQLTLQGIFIGAVQADVPTERDYSA